MPINVGELVVKASGDTRDAEQGIDAVSGGFSALQDEIKQVGSHLRLVSNQITEVGTKSATAAAAGLDAVTSELQNMRRASEASSAQVAGLGKELAKVQEEAESRRLREAAAAMDDTAERSRRLRGNLTGAASAIGTLGGQAGVAAGQVVRLGGMLAGNFAMGGVVGIGIGAVAAGIQAIATSTREAAAEARQLQALNDVLGVTERDVRNVERAFQMAGNELDRAVVQKLIATTREAGTSTVELAAMAGEIKRIQDLTGMDAAGAAAKIAADKAKAAGEDYLATIRAESDALEDQQAGIAAWQRTIEDGTRKDEAALDAVLGKLDTLSQKHGRAVAQYGFESDAATTLRNEQRALFDERDRLRKSLADASEVYARREALAEIEEGRKSGDAYVAEVMRKRAAAEADARRREAERKREAAEALRTQQEIARISSESSHRVRILQAQAAEDRKAEISALADFEIERSQAVAAEHVELQAAMAAQIEAINAKRRTDLAKVDSDAAKESAKNAADARKELERSLADKEKTTQAGQIAGIQAGAAFSQGLKAGIQNDDPLAIFKGLLSAGATIMGAMGNPVAGAGLSAIGGLFHDGGMIGTGGKPLPKYHSGGMIVAHKGIMLPQPGPGEVPIMGQLGEGVLSRRGVAAAGGPAAVRGYNEGRAPPASAPMQVTIVNSSFDQRGVAQEIGRVFEPAQYRRGVSRQDAKRVSQIRKQARGPRSGML